MIYIFLEEQSEGRNSAKYSEDYGKSVMWYRNKG
jgi:hypothetical protein